MAERQTQVHDTSGPFPVFLAAWIQLFVPQPCFDKFFIDFNFLDVPCMKVVISKGLGYAIILGSCIVKIPQIIKLVQAKSAEGLNITSVCFELLAISAAWSYGFAKQFPFSAYGEAMFLAFQTILIAFFIQFYSGKIMQAFLSVAAYVAVMLFFLSPYVPMEVLSFVQGGNVLVVASAKLIQAYSNYNNKSTGQQSAITVSLIALGALGRIFTSIQETGDYLVVITYVVSTCCNFLLIFQLIRYWHNTMPQPQDPAQLLRHRPHAD